LGDLSARRARDLPHPPASCRAGPRPTRSRHAQGTLKARCPFGQAFAWGLRCIDASGASCLPRPRPQDKRLLGDKKSCHPFHPRLPSPPRGVSTFLGGMTPQEPDSHPARFEPATLRFQVFTLYHWTHARASCQHSLLPSISTCKTFHAYLLRSTCARLALDLRSRPSPGARVAPGLRSGYPRVGSCLEAA